MITKTESNSRAFNCKIEELVMICRFGLLLARRDLNDFTAFSPMFNESYFNDFEAKIIAADELVSPKTETEEMKRITKRLHSDIDSLLEPINKLRGYLQIAKNTVGMSDKDFGISLLCRKIHYRDVEGVRQNLIFINRNIQTYREQLSAVGLNEEIVNYLTGAVEPITQNNQRQFEILSHRKLTANENLIKLNELYENLMGFINIGKVIYKIADPTKSKEYSFENLKKNVRITTSVKPSPEAK